jgi:hypothetical protein
MTDNLERKLQKLAEKPTLKPVELRKCKVFAPTRTSSAYPQGRRRWYFGVALPSAEGKDLVTVVTREGRVLQVTNDRVDFAT